MVPQVIVAIMASWAGRRANTWGRRPLLLVGFAALPIRALVFAWTTNPMILIAAQVLDGVSGTMLGVLTALIIADLTAGTGQFNLGRDASCRRALARVPATLVRPSIDPKLMIQMLIVGYWYGLRLERKLAQEVELRLAYRWFCRLDLDNKVSHHSTFSENRPHRFRQSDVLRHMRWDTFGDNYGRENS